MTFPRLSIWGVKSRKFDLRANIHHKHNRMENSKDSAPNDVSKSAGEQLDKTTEDTKSFMTSVGEQFDKTAESVTTFVKGALPSSRLLLNLNASTTHSKCTQNMHNKRLIFHSGFLFLGQYLCSSVHRSRRPCSQVCRRASRQNHWRHQVLHDVGGRAIW